MGIIQQKRHVRKKSGCPEICDNNRFSVLIIPKRMHYRILLKIWSEDHPNVLDNSGFISLYSLRANRTLSDKGP